MKALVNVPLFPDRASTVAGEVDTLFFFLVGITVLFAGLIFLSVLYFAIRYRRRPKDGAPPPPPHALKLEIIWTAVPLFIVMVIFVWGTSLYFKLATPPPEALEITGVGKQWMWKFQHPSGQREINALHVPIGRPVRLTMTSEDVIHSFYVPAFRVKSDVVPGRYTQAWFQATQVGTYHLFCAEYCGTKHAEMGGWVHVMEPADYQTWLSGEATAETPVESGKRLFTQLGCVTCHRQDAIARGPSLLGVYGRTVAFTSGRTQLADEGYLRESILKPNTEIVSGYQKIMPTYAGLISEEGLMQLIAYIKSLGEADSAAVGAGSGEAQP
jgi:cytochrome c oxidase subunit 2